MEKKSIDIAVVTVFNPDDGIVDNIKSYINYVKELLIVDNSLTPYDFSLLQKEFPSITILSTHINLGIAKSLNIAVEYASSKNYKWLLTMDQDSYFESNEIEKTIYFFNKTIDKNLALFSPLHNKKFLKRQLKNIDNVNEMVVMTSGNIINIDIALKIGCFDENLFIDEVDHDYCLRLNNANYRVIQNHNCYLNHTLGKKENNRTIYSPQRLYYMFRNYLYLRVKHQKRPIDFFKKRTKYLIKFFLKQFLYTTEKRKIFHILYMAQKDYKNGSMGYKVGLNG